MAYSRIFVSMFVIISFWPSFSHAQLQTWPDDDSCEVFHYNKISQMPPVNPSMPWQVIVGYVALDSIFRSGDYGDVMSRASTLTPDSIEIGLQYYFNLRDYDPILFYEYRSMQYEYDAYSCTSTALYDALDSVYFNSENQWTRIDNILMYSDYIHHVRVYDQTLSTGTIAFGYTSDDYCSRVVPLERVSGQMIPNCCISGDEETPAECYPITWSGIVLTECQNADDSAYALARGADMLSPNKEYIVFLSLDRLRPPNESTGTMIITQSAYIGGNNWALEVVDGYVQDVNNYFGLGTNVPYNDFVAYLYDRRNELLGM